MCCFHFSLAFCLGESWRRNRWCMTDRLTDHFLSIRQQYLDFVFHCSDFFGCCACSAPVVLGAGKNVSLLSLVRCWWHAWSDCRCMLVSNGASRSDRWREEMCNERKMISGSIKHKMTNFQGNKDWLRNYRCVYAYCVSRSKKHVSIDKKRRIHKADR